MDDASSSAIRSVGVSLFTHEGLTGFDRLRFQDVPTASNLEYYIEFDVSPKAGTQVIPSVIRMVLFRPGQDASASYQVRSNADGFSSVISTAGWNGTAGSSYHILEADLSSLEAFTNTRTFRLYLSDARGDGGIYPVGSTASWPYGIQLIADSADAVPEPSSFILLCLGGLSILSRRKRI